ncbi:MAG: hypothetical protein HKN76_22740, partial [Saprospiraceae bacterium]|nr:hypothetical protein [Saprospiraceae bacterium]
VYQTSTVKIVVNREVLYDFQLKNKGKDPLLRILMRLYQGILNDFVAIRENVLAELLSTSRQRIVSDLKELTRDGIIAYEEQDDQERLTMLRERVRAENLTIDQVLFRFRKDNRRQGIDRMLEYVETQGCRQFFLLHYFGDELEVDCGVCDHCKAVGKRKMNRTEYLEIKQQILEKIEEGQQVRDLLGLFPPQRQNWVITVLQYLLNEEAVIKVNGALKLKVRS